MLSTNFRKAAKRILAALAICAVFVSIAVGVTAYRNRYGDADVAFVRISADLFNSLEEVRISEEQPVDDQVLSAHVVGQSKTEATLKVAFEPHPDTARFSVVLSGTTISETIGQTWPIEIESLTKTTFEATKFLTFDRSGLKSTPATVIGKSEITTKGITTQLGVGRRIVGLIAEGEVAKARTEAQRIAWELNSGRVAEGFDKSVDEFVKKANDYLGVNPMFGETIGDDETLTLHASTTSKYALLRVSRGKGDDSLLPQLDKETTPLTVGLNVVALGANYDIVTASVEKARARFEQHTDSNRNERLAAIIDEAAATQQTSQQGRWSIFRFNVPHLVARQELPPEVTQPEELPLPSPQ